MRKWIHPSYVGIQNWVCHIINDMTISLDYEPFNYFIIYINKV
jgi:hypothetical protein